jgi:hypothetical protein
LWAHWPRKATGPLLSERVFQVSAEKRGAKSRTLSYADPADFHVSVFAEYSNTV